MRRWSAALVVMAVTLSLITSLNGNNVQAESVHTTPTLTQCRTLVRHELYSAGHLTVATNSTVLDPWFEKNIPANGLGYESALTYALASELGFTSASVHWTVEPYAQSYSSGAKAFDFDINEIVRTTARAKNVTFSSSYYNVQQSLVAMKSSAVVAHHLPADLKHYRYGALTGSPALAFVKAKIVPKIAVHEFATQAAEVAALESNAIDAIAVDTPTGNFLVDWLILDISGNPLATQVGQFAANGDEYYGLLLQKNNPLVGCLNVAIATARANGTIKNLTTKWLSVFTKVPVIKP